MTSCCNKLQFVQEISMWAQSGN